MSKYKAVIFDLGDVYYQNGFKKALAKLVEKHTLSKRYYDDVFSKIYIKKIETSKISEREFWKAFKEDTGLANIDANKLRKQVFGYFVPQKGMPKLVRDCRKKVKVGLLTNNVKSWFKIQDIREKFKEKFDEIIVSADVGIRKPGKEIYLLMAKKLKTKPSDCVFFDDLSENVEGAKKVGMKAFKFKGTKNCERILKNLGVL